MKAWSTQRIANRFPSWSKARQQEDSALQTFTNPFGLEFDKLWSQLLQIRHNYYIETADLNSTHTAYVLQLPYDFAFVQNTSTVGFSWVDPIITGDGNEVTVVATWETIDKNLVPPTRLTIANTGLTFSNIVSDAISIVDIDDTLVFDTDGLATMGILWFEINDAELFGETLDNGIVVEPKIVIVGERQEDKYLDDFTEHLRFTTNTLLPSQKAYTDLTSIELRGIYGDSTTLDISLGFNKSLVQEPYGLFVTDTEEYNFAYALDTVVIDSVSYALVEWTTPEVIDPQLAQQGFNDRQVVTDAALLVDESFVDTIIAIERQPFSPWLIVLTATDVHWIDITGISIGSVYTQSLMDKMYSAFHNNKSYEPALVWEPNSNNVLWSDSGVGSLVIKQHDTGLTIRSVRLSRYYLTSVLNHEYIDLEGNIIDITTYPNQGFIPVIGAWKNITLLPDLKGLGTYFAVYILECQLEGGATSNDSVMLYMNVLEPSFSYPLPVELEGAVNGMTYNWQQQLFIQDQADGVWSVQPCYDYAVVDFRANKVYLKEEYDTVEVTS